ncbi:MAG: hypothetical protein HOV80_25600, partial [Polyangiaceae bacterium]|nr:hypothetical protein [Polyangiaceae bacterium]
KDCQLLCDASTEIFTTCNTSVNVSGIAEPAATSFRSAMTIVEAAGLEAERLQHAVGVVENNRGGCTQIEQAKLNAARNRIDAILLGVYGSIGF